MPRLTLEIDERLYSAAENEAKDGDFASVGEYILFILKDVLLDDGESPSCNSKDDKEGVRERLKSLGYID